MPILLCNIGKRWTARELSRLRRMARKHVSPKLICLKLGRSTSSVYAKASQEGIRLRYQES